MFRHIIHFHVPAFAIAVARVCHPNLKDRPVAVAPPQSDRGLILSASLEARKEGVFKGVPLVKAKKRCPGLTLIPPDPGLVERAWEKLTQMTAFYTPVWEPSRPGHIYLDVTGTERLWGRAKDTAARIRQEVKHSLRLPAIAGIAANKMVSSIASRIMLPEGIRDVGHGREATFMAPLDVGVVPGIGRVRKKILLEELNIFQVRELAALDMDHLILIFSRQAFVIHQRAIGIDPTPVYPTPVRPMISDEIRLSEDDNDDGALLGHLSGLVAACALRMRERDLFPRKAGLLIRYSDHMEVKRQIRLPHATFWDFDLYEPLKRLFLRAYHRRVRLRFIRVWFHDFSAPSGQLSLFHEPSPDREKKARVIQALDCIRKKYGKTAVCPS
jgi:DNA polymerase-4